MLPQWLFTVECSCTPSHTCEISSNSSSTTRRPPHQISTKLPTHPHSHLEGLKHQSQSTSILCCQDTGNFLLLISPNKEAINVPLKWCIQRKALLLCPRPSSFSPDQKLPRSHCRRVITIMCWIHVEL